MKVLICDDHKIFRDGVRLALQTSGTEMQIFEATEGTEALEIIKREPIDLVLMDIELPGKNGLELAYTITTKWPGVKVLMLSQHTEPSYARTAHKHGASGYLNKHADAEKLLDAIDRVMKDEKYFPASVLAAQSQKARNDTRKTKHDVLSDLEFEIMIELAKEKSVKNIAVEMGRSNKTISAHKSRIIKKMEFQSFIDMRNYCIEQKYFVDSLPEKD